MVRDAISDYLDEKGVTQSHLSKKSGLSPQAICTYLKGGRGLDIEEYIKICDALEVSYEFFMEYNHPAWPQL